MNYKLREYSFWGTVGKGFNLYFNNFLQIILIALLCWIPGVLILRFANFEGISIKYIPIEIGSLVRPIVAWFLYIFAYTLLSAWIGHFFSRKLLETSPDNRDNHRNSTLSVILPVIGLSLLISLAITLGFIFLIVPGMIFLLRYSMAPLVLVIEKRPVIESLKRSWELTKGNRATIFLYMLVAYQMIAAVNFYTLGIIGLLKPDSPWIVYLNDSISIFTSPFMACVLVVVYFNVRIAKEGFNIEHLVQQFSLIEPEPEESTVSLQHKSY